MQSFKIVTALFVAIALASCGQNLKMNSCGNGVFVEEGKTCPTSPVTPPAVTDAVITALTATTKFRVCGVEVRLRNLDGSITYFQGSANGMKILSAARTTVNGTAVVQGKMNGEFFEFTAIPQLASENWAVGTEMSQDGKQGTFLSPGCTK